MSGGPSAPASISAPKIFICYRREETAAYAGRLYDAVSDRYGEENVFMDLDLGPGIDFVERITQAVGSCHVLLVVMGPKWATVQDQDGEVRITDPEDYVRLEVETGLRRADVTLIPVLVGGATMPRREKLPAEIRALTRRNALELSDARWRYDVGRLTAALDQLLAELTGTHVLPLPREPSAPSLPPRRLIVEAALVGAVAALLAFWLGDARAADAETSAGKIARLIFLRAETWAIACAALAIWLTLRIGGGGLVRRGLIGLLVGAIGGALGGAIFALPQNLTDLKSDTTDWIDVGAFAVMGGFMGALLGAIWRPPRVGLGLASGIAAGAVIELILRPLELKGVAAYGIRGAVIAGVALGALLLLHPQRSAAEPSVGVTAAEP
jgi:TIR domain